MGKRAEGGKEEGWRILRSRAWNELSCRVPKIEARLTLGYTIATRASAPDQTDGEGWSRGSELCGTAAERSRPSKGTG